LVVVPSLQLVERPHHFDHQREVVLIVPKPLCLLERRSHLLERFVSSHPHVPANDTEGKLFVTDRDLANVQVFTDEGEFIMKWGDSI